MPTTTYTLPPKATLISKLESLAPNRNFCFTAVEHLKSKKEIRQFMQEYEDWMVLNATGRAVENPVETARANIGYILGYYDNKTRKRWYAILEKVSHPIFGPTFGRTW